ncbi:MAG: flagellar hook-associated protein FlgK [Melioribacteraceae bacterium]
MSLSNLFSISRSSLFAHQKALAVTSANIANANNPAYTRQVVMFGTATPNHRESFSFGSGVNVDKVLRVRNQVTDAQIRLNNQSYFSAEKQAGTLRQVESLFSEPTELGLSNLMSQFFNSWDELAVDPHSTDLRTNVVQAGQKISEKVSSIHSGITQTKTDVANEAKNVVRQVNTIVEQLHTVNKQIYEASSIKSFNNDLLDKRDILLDELSSLVSINVSIDDKNVANVSIGGIFATDGLHHVEFALDQDGDRISLMTKDGAAKTRLQGGSLKGLTELYNKDLPQQLKDLETITQALMENVNDIHSKGHTLTDPQVTGVNFFTKFDKGVLEINQDILDDPFFVAVSSDGADGNNKIALEIAALRNGKLLDNRTLAENYSDLVSGVANKINLQEQKQDSYGLVLHQLHQQKAEYSGVSTDEEMIHILEYQKSYDAAAKLVRVADELLQTIISLV